MILGPLSAVGSLGSAAAVAGPSAASSAAAGVAKDSGPDFGTVLANVAASATDTLKSGEATAIAGIEGKASVQQVVQAVMSAQETLQAAIAIRDKVVGAYQEITRMPI